MAALEINSVASKGDLENECVWLQAKEEIANLQFYLLCDTTYTADDQVSNELRHTFWFPRIAVKKGEWIRLWTKDGKYNVVQSTQNVPIHNVYWKLGRTVWNRDGDAAKLFNLKGWDTKRA